jgi:predicted XRE-type DNA-binding protein
MLSTCRQLTIKICQLSFLVLLSIAFVSASHGQPTSGSALSSSDAQKFLKEYTCYYMRAASIQTPLLEKWFKSVGATSQEFTQYKTYMEAVSRFICDEISEAEISTVKSPLPSIITRYSQQHSMSAAEAQFAVQASLTRYSDLLSKSCNLPSGEPVSREMMARAISSNPSSLPPVSPPSEASQLGTCGAGGSSGVPEPGGDDISVLGSGARQIYAQCWREITELATQPQCANNPLAFTVPQIVKYSAGVVAAGATIAAAYVTSPLWGPVLAGVAAGSAIVAVMWDAVDDYVNEQEKEAMKKALETIVKEHEKEKLKITEAMQASTTSGGTPQPQPEPQPNPEQQCGRFPVAGTSYSLGYTRSDGGVTGLLDMLTECRCKAKAADCPQCPTSDECKSEDDRKRADCLRNPYDEVDRPREECMKLLLEDNSATVNIESFLCRQVQCANRRASKRLAFSGNRTVACGCFGSSQGRASVQPASPMGSVASCLTMRCETECVCRGRQCSCKGNEPRVDPRNPPRPPRQPTLPWYPGADTTRGLLR